MSVGYSEGKSLGGYLNVSYRILEDGKMSETPELGGKVSGERLVETVALLGAYRPSLVKETAFQETGPGGADETELLEVEELRVAGAVVVWGGNVEEAAVQMGKPIEEFMEVFNRGHVRRCVAWMANNRRQVRFALIRRSVERALIKYPDSWLESAEVPPETKRKILRDLMEADAVFPRDAVGAARTMVQVNVVMPEWKKEAR